MRAPIHFALALTLACGASSTPSHPATEKLIVTGVFDLYSINGALLPTHLVNTTVQQYEVFSETYTLRADYTYTRTQSYRVATAATGTNATGALEQTGTFSVSTNAIAFAGSVSSGSFTTIAIRNGDAFAITLSQTQQTLIFRKR
jgi:hypothetical protein